MKNIRTDLALEAREMHSGVPKGVECQSVERGGAKVTRVKIINDEGAAALGKPVGNYITIEESAMKDCDGEVYNRVCEILAQELSALLPARRDSHVLVAGLGNQYITSDSIGPKTVSKLLITRHLKEYMPDEAADLRPVSAVAPGVLGLTGIETGEILRGVVERISPALVIVVDALAARRLERVGTTVQIADTGISPGSGVGNNRKELSKATLGVPVIALGVPTVVDASTVAQDAIENMLEGCEMAARAVGELTLDERNALFDKAIGRSAQSMIVTPKEIDNLCERASKIIAGGINLALQSPIGQSEIERLLS